MQSLPKKISKVNPKEGVVAVCVCVCVAPHHLFWRSLAFVFLPILPPVVEGEWCCPTEVVGLNSRAASSLSINSLMRSSPPTLSCVDSLYILVAFCEREAMVACVCVCVIFVCVCVQRQRPGEHASPATPPLQFPTPKTVLCFEHTLLGVVVRGWGSPPVTGQVRGSDRRERRLAIRHRLLASSTLHHPAPRRFS